METGHIKAYGLALFPTLKGILNRRLVGLTCLSYAGESTAVVYNVHHVTLNLQDLV